MIGNIIAGILIAALGIGLLVYIIIIFSEPFNNISYYGYKLYDIFNIQKMTLVTTNPEPQSSEEPPSSEEPSSSEEPQSSDQSVLLDNLFMYERKNMIMPELTSNIYAKNNVKKEDNIHHRMHNASNSGYIQ